MVDVEHTLLLVKPDGVERGLVGKIISRFESRGYRISALRMLHTTKEILSKHYASLSEKPFFPSLVDGMVDRDIVALVVSGKGIISTARLMIGATDPLKAAPGTIRAEYSIDVGRNVIHGSDSPESAQREIALWFPDFKPAQKPRVMESLIYE